MKYPVLTIALLAVALAACNKQAPAPAATGTTPADQSSQAAEAPPVKAPPRRITPEEIAQIDASGKTGLWSDVTAVCPKDAKAGARTTLTWNVKASGAERVVVYVVDKNGQERNFGQGGPIGLKETGPWLRPGITFKIRAADSKQELGNVVIGEKQC